METATSRKDRVPKRIRRSDCPIHFALEVFGDRWTLLILRDLLFKEETTYGGFLRGEEGIATNVLADRLSRLERDGIIVKEPHERGSKGRYYLTTKGIDLVPILLETIRWSARYDERTAAEPAFVERLDKDRTGLEREIRSDLRRAGHGRPSRRRRTTGRRPKSRRNA